MYMYPLLSIRQLTAGKIDRESTLGTPFVEHAETVAEKSSSEMQKMALLLIGLPMHAGFAAPGALSAARPIPVRSSLVDMMGAKRGPFKLPDPPADFAGAQWAPHCFPPFKFNIDVKPAAEVAKNMKAEQPVAVKAVESPAPAPPAAPAADKSTFTVTLQNPDGMQTVEYDPASDAYLLDYLDELDNADDYADLPYACRAGSCSACAAKVVSGTMDSSACSFLSDEQKADGWVLTCTAKPTSDVVLATHKEDDLF